MLKKMIGAASMAAVLLTASAWAQPAPLSELTGLNAQDKQFLETIGQSTLGEVALGKLAAQKGTTPAVRLFGRWMASTDALANRQLASMIKELHGPMLPTTLTADQRAELQKMQALSGAEFDRQYVQMMVPGHNTEIALFQKEAQDGLNPSIRDFAQNLLPTAKEHLAAVQDLLATTASK